MQLPNTTTFKVLEVASCGAVTFSSSIYTGLISGKEITKQSAVLNLLEPGDEILADEGFLIENMLAGIGVRLIIPPFKHGKQFSKKECEQTDCTSEKTGGMGDKKSYQVN